LESILGYKDTITNKLYFGYGISDGGVLGRPEAGESETRYGHFVEMRVCTMIMMGLFD